MNTNMLIINVLNLEDIIGIDLLEYVIIERIVKVLNMRVLNSLIQNSTFIQKNTALDNYYLNMIRENIEPQLNLLVPIKLEAYNIFLERMEQINRQNRYNKFEKTKQNNFQ